jgi:hypothetical protein
VLARCMRGFGRLQTHHLLSPVVCHRAPGAALGADSERQRPGGVPWHLPPMLDSRRWSLVQHVAIVTWCNRASVSSRIPAPVRAGEPQVTASYRSLDLDIVNGHNGSGAGRHERPLAGSTIHEAVLTEVGYSPPTPYAAKRPARCQSAIRGLLIAHRSKFASRLEVNIGMPMSPALLIITCMPTHGPRLHPRLEPRTPPGMALESVPAPAT